jgi:hypothetical protein
MDSNYNQTVKITLVPGNVAPKYLDEEPRRQELFIDEVIITEQGMQSGLPMVDFKLKGADGKTYLFVLSGRMVNAISATVRGVNFRNHGVDEP